MLLETTGLDSTFSIGTLAIVRVAKRPFTVNWRGAPCAGPLTCSNHSAVYNQILYLFCIAALSVLPLYINKKHVLVNNASLISVPPYA
jgi:hypothetical protein